MAHRKVRTVALRPVDAKSVIAQLRQLALPRLRAEMESRYGIPSKKAFGVAMNRMQRVAKECGRDHALAAALWKSGWYEARMVACMIDDPAQVTPVQMDRWCRDFDSWAICDTVCFKLFDRSPHALAKVEQWARGKDQGEFIQRGAFALLACVALHDRELDDKPFLRLLPLVEKAAGDERNFVKKGLLWALRGVGGRSPALHAAVIELAGRLAESESPAARWVGRNAIRELTKSAARSRPSP